MCWTFIFKLDVRLNDYKQWKREKLLFRLSATGCERMYVLGFLMKKGLKPVSLPILACVCIYTHRHFFSNNPTVHVDWSENVIGTEQQLHDVCLSLTPWALDTFSLWNRWCVWVLYQSSLPQLSLRSFHHTQISAITIMITHKFQYFWVVNFVRSGLW